MKKIIAIVLALVCLLAVASCKSDKTDDIDRKSAELREAFSSAIASSKPAAAKVDTKYESKLGTLNGTFAITYGETTSTVEFRYETYKILSDNPDDGSIIDVHEGVVSVDANGNYSDGDALYGTAKIATAVKINLDGELESFSATGSVFIAVVKAENTEAVLGVKINADVTLKITKSQSRISTVSFSYTDNQADVGRIDVNVSCSYEYAE